MFYLSAEVEAGPVQMRNPQPGLRGKKRKNGTPDGCMGKSTVAHGRDDPGFETRIGGLRNVRGI